MFGAADIAEEKAIVDEYESGSTEEKVVLLSLKISLLVSLSTINLTLSDILIKSSFIQNSLLQVDNDFPEGDVDDMRAQMDSVLLRYIAAAERKVHIQERGSGAKKSDDRGEDDMDEEEKKAARDREKKRMSSRKS